MAQPEHLSSERLWLRGLCADDRPFVFKLIADQRVRQFLGGAVAADDRETVFKGYCETGKGEATWLVELTCSKAPVGLVFLSHHKDGADVELSYQFDPDYWGQGYATEALRRVLRHAAEGLGFKRIIAETQSANVPSRRVLERLGMVEQRRIERFGAVQIIYAN